MPAVAPVFVGNFPVLVGIGFTGFEARELLVLGDEEEKFQQDGSVVHELALEFIDLAVGAFPGVLTAKTLHAFDEDAAIPGAIKNHDLPLRWKLVPKPP